MDTESTPPDASQAQDSPAGFQRTRHFLPAEQIRFAVTVLFYALLFPLLMLGLLATFVKLQALITGEISEQGVLYETLQIETVRFAIDNFWFTLGSLVYVGILTLFFSHRIFGPIKVFDRALRQRLQDPEQTVDCSLRKGDYFQDFSKLLDRVLNKSAEAPEPVKDPPDPS